MVTYYIAIFVFVLLYCIYCMLFKNRNYWRDRNVPYVKPLPLFGNYKDFLLLKRHATDIDQEICQQFPDEPYIGIFFGTDPALLIQDPSLLKIVMLKDFYYFNGREVSEYNDKEMLTQNMFLAHGDEWKVLRTNLTPLFSSAKLKNMFYLIKNCSDTLESFIDEEIKINSRIDARGLLSKYTIECITICAFGLSSNAMKRDNSENPFAVCGKKIFELTDFNAFKTVFRAMWPAVFYALSLNRFDKHIGKFFRKLMIEIFKSRQETNTLRHDFVDLVLTWKNGKYISGDSMSNIKTGDRKTVNIEVNDDLLLSQCFLFFGAGFESTSASTSFLLYELAKNKIAQDKVIEEVDEYFAKYNIIEFECIYKMPYVEACLQESLRLYPVLGLLTREVMDEYTLPTGLRFKKGDRIHIPVYHIQRNPKYFPEPEVFDPQRFLGEAKKNIKSFTYMPFGEGPRICIGTRFAKMAIYAALLKIFKNYRVELAEDMPKTLTISPKSVISQPVGGIYLKFIPRNL